MASTPIQYNWISASATYIAAIQTVGGAGGAMTLAVSPTVLTGMVRAVSLTSVNNNAAINFTVTGTINGRAASQTIAGPNNNTVETTTIFDTITSIVGSAAFTNVSAGIGHTGQTQWFTNDYNRTVFNMSCAADVTNGTGAITYSLISTLDDPTIIAPLVFNPDANMINLNVDHVGSSIIPCRYSAISISASTNDASLRAVFLQQGVT